MFLEELTIKAFIATAATQSYPQDSIIHCTLHDGVRSLQTMHCPIHIIHLAPASQSHPEPLHKSDPLQWSSNLSCHASPSPHRNTGVVAVPCKDEEELIEAPDNSKDRFSFELGVSARPLLSPSGGRVYCTDPREGESAGVLGSVPPLPNS